MSAHRVYRVVPAPRVLADLDEIHRHVASLSPQGADTLLDRLREGIAALAHHPARHGPAVESRKRRPVLRQAIVGSYRVLFEISGNEVWVYMVRHAARRPARVSRGRPA
ncbi:MAG: type II toxin-antitoxin system RelE/ParE family toxin [Phycisphaerales bacterium]|nr:type II toxin-antitoxin system RelE/ParE family toxin [Phycisphaerales bacterium]